MSELKPCPKCSLNGAPLRRIGEMDEYRVECVECYTVKTPWFKTLKEAEAYWNAFAEGMKQQAARIAELEQMAEAHKLANRLLEQERNELEVERNRMRKALQAIARFANNEYEKRIPAPSCVKFLTIKLCAKNALKEAENREDQNDSR